MPLKSWICAAAAAVVLSMLWGVCVQRFMTEKSERRWPRGLILGALEGIIFTATFAGVAVLGAAWLGFKVASKWKSWALMADASKKVDPLDIDTQYHRFLVGTAGNVVIG